LGGVLLVPVGGVPFDLVVWLGREVRARLPGGLRVLVFPSRVYLPLTVYNYDRRQFDALRVNSFLAGVFAEVLSGGWRVVGIVNGDGYVDGLNFVFGLASPESGVASVYTWRLRGGEDGLGGLFRVRTLKVTVHEIGHLYGLGHCSNPGCVMRFSNSLEELDSKGDTFCPTCYERLSRNSPASLPGPRGGPSPPPRASGSSRARTG